MGLVWVWGLAQGWREALPGSNGSRRPSPGRTAYPRGRGPEVGWVRRGRPVSPFPGARPGIFEAARCRILPGLPPHSGVGPWVGPAYK